VTKLGLALPTFGPAANPEAIAEVAEGAERIGLASVWTSERLLVPIDGARPVGGGDPVPLPESYHSGTYDPIETLAYVAARTTTIALGTSVLDALLHSPIVLARRLATLDRLCGGRLIAGLGQGWMAAEFEAAGMPATPRGPRLEEHVAAMRAVWGPDPAAHDGRYYRIESSWIGPKPVGSDGVVVLVGAVAAPAIERAARMGTGLNPIMMTWEMLDDVVTTFRAAAEKAGHDPDSLPIVMRVNGSVTTSPADQRQPLTGGVAQVLEDLERVRAAGVDHVFWAMDTEPEQQLEVMAELRRSAG
jgi:probable F420-dependent oxidoreductase